MKRLLALLLLPSTAFAFVIGQGIQESAPDSVCRILIRDPQKKLISICSGTLSGPKEVTTAAHCVPELKDGNSATVQCGFVREPGKPVIEKTRLGGQVVVNAEFRESFTTQTAMADPRYSEYSDTHDIARIVLPKESRLTPMKIASSADLSHFFDSQGQIHSSAQCRAAGYGVNPQGTTGLLYSISLPTIFQGDDLLGFGKTMLLPPSFQAQLGEISVCKHQQDEKGAIAGIISFVRDLVGQGFFESSTLPGDSGGPLYCRESESSPWVLIGAAEGMGLSSDEQGQSYSQKWSILDFTHLQPVK